MGLGFRITVSRPVHARSFSSLVVDHTAPLCSVACLPQTLSMSLIHIKPKVLLTADPVDVQPAKHIFTCTAAELAERCLSQAAESPFMSDEAVAAMRAPLPALSRSGSWSAACANCTAGASALASVAEQDRAAFRHHCLDCGFGASSSTFRVRAASEQHIRKIDL